MDATQVAFHKEELIKKASLAHANKKTPKPEDFLQDSWKTLSDFVHYNKRDPLIQHAVYEYKDLIPRSYLILLLFFNACSYVPDRYALVKEFIGMLDDDLVEKELRVCEYAKDKLGFIQGLSRVMPDIRRVYGAEHFSLAVLPPTPYLAFVLFVLNHPEKIEQRLTLEELFGILAFHDSQFKKCISLCTS